MLKMLSSHLTLLIHSCDKFSDLWDAHINLLEKNWADRNCRTIILTDKPTSQRYQNVEIICAGENKEITSRIRHVLPLIDTEYVLVTLDDYFLTTPIDTHRIERIIKIMANENYDYTRLFERPKKGWLPTTEKDIYRLDLKGDYQVNLYAGIWRKDFIERTLGDRELNAWEFEVSLTENARQANGICTVSSGKDFPILDVVRKGCILPTAWKYLKKNNLYYGDRTRMSLWAYCMLAVKTYSNRILAKLPTPMYENIKTMCVKLGMKSFSANKKHKLI